MQESKHDILNSWLTLGVVVIGTFMSILDSSIVNIALPKMMAVFGVSLDDAKWILISYTLALGAIIPLTGYLQEVFGSKRIYMFALGMFTVGSMLCGFAWSNTSMIIFRVFQAIGGGMIMPVGMSIIYQIFPRERLSLALGFWGISAMAAPTIGPTLGGFIIEKMDWRLIFNVNIPIGIIGVVIAGFVLKGSEMKKFKSFDIIGFVSSTIGLVSILYVLGEGSSIDWTKIENPLLVTLGSLSLIIFVVNELLHPEPLVELRIFKLYDFSLSQGINAILTLATMGGAYVLPIFLQNFRGYTPMETGMIMLPGAVVMGIMMPISGSLFDKIGAKAIVIPGLILVGVSSFGLANAISMNSSKETIILINCVRSIGLGLSTMPISNIGMNVVPKNLVGKASALSSTIRQIVGSLSVAIMSTLIQSKSDYNYGKLAEQITAYNSVSNDMIKKLTALYVHSGQSLVNAKISAVSYLSKIIRIQSGVDAMQYCVNVTAVIVLFAIGMTFFIKEKQLVKKQAKVGELNES